LRHKTYELLSQTLQQAEPNSWGVHCAPPGASLHLTHGERGEQLVFGGGP